MYRVLQYIVIPLIHVDPYQQIPQRKFHNGLPDRKINVLDPSLGIGRPPFQLPAGSSAWFRHGQGMGHESWDLLMRNECDILIMWV